MRSGNPDVYKPPGGRTEQDVAAEVCVRILESGRVPRTPETVNWLAAAVGIPVRKVREVWAIPRWRSSRLDRSPVSGRAPLEAVPEPPETKPEADVVQLPARKHQPRPARPKPGETPEERFARRSKSPDSRQLKAKEPEPGKRRCGCPLHKGKLVAIEQFDIKDKRRGTLTSWCSEGRKLYQRERYLSSKKIAKLGAVLEFVLADDDEHVGELCIDCERPCKAGERVVASAVSLHHAQHYRREISDADG